MKFLLIIFISSLPVFCIAQDKADTSSKYILCSDNITDVHAQKLILNYIF
jgi:hypothetical protein